MREHTAAHRALELERFVAEARPEKGRELAASATPA
jgi:hypothetical protein